jgi:hypothetical protein
MFYNIFKCNKIFKQLENQFKLNILFFQIQHFYYKNINVTLT